MSPRIRCILTALVCSFALSYFSGSPLVAQNQRNQSPQAPTNKTPAKPAEPEPEPGTPIHISPGIVKMIQQKLVSMGLPVPSVSGAWGETSAAALAEYQRKQGLDPGGDLDELTLTALGMPEVMRGDVPPGGDMPVSASAAATGGAPFSVSPQLTRVVQNELAEAGFPPHNVLGLWITEIDRAGRNFQKAKGLDITNTLDLAVLHTLGLTDSLLNPKPGKLPTDLAADVMTDEARLMTGTPLRISSIGLRQVQEALGDKDVGDVEVNGEWSDELSAVVKKFQEAQKLDATGHLDFRTLKALGFVNPLMELDRPDAK